MRKSLVASTTGFECQIAPESENGPRLVRRLREVIERDAGILC